jgi:hypothetical protein
LKIENCGIACGNILNSRQRRHIHFQFYIFNYQLKIKKPIIPQLGTKGIPSAVPPTIRQNGALKSAITLATCNGVTRPSLLKISGGSSREKARYRTQAARTIPLSLFVVFIHIRQPDQGLCISSRILAYS